VGILCIIYVYRTLLPNSMDLRGADNRSNREVDGDLFLVDVKGLTPFSDQVIDKTDLSGNFNFTSPQYVVPCVTSSQLKTYSEGDYPGALTLPTVPSKRRYHLALIVRLTVQNQTSIGSDQRK
jgi:hypothetical protein